MRAYTPLLNWMMVPAAITLVALLGLSLARIRDPKDTLTTMSAARRPLPPNHPAPEQTSNLFSWAANLAWQPLTNSGNPFFTLAIQPPPPPKPPPPPPATRKIDVTYRGFFQTAAGVRRAVVQVADTQIIGALGEKIVADYLAAAIELRHLTVTNPAGLSITFAFATNQTIEVPAP